MSRSLLSLVVPFYNEEEAIPGFFAQVVPALEAIAEIDFEIVCVNDGSKDRTLTLLAEAAEADDRVLVVDLSRNFGKEAAMSAGLAEAQGHVVVPFDADLQDPPEVIAKLVEKWREGYDVVLARRSDRSSDSYLKRQSALGFYRLHNKLAEVKIPENVGDFRLMTREVVNVLNALPESRRFMKGLFAWVGYRTAEVTYVRHSRCAGKTKFSGWRLWNFALEGITSFSTLPLRMWTYFGLLVAATSFLYAAYLVIRTLVHGIEVPGYASIFVSLLFFSGVQMIGIGVIGEYVGRIYIESKRRPLYVVRRRYGKSQQ
ncbi:CPS-53 (KpLE1) prophage; bactoprenol glucosyl transferase [Paraburkholderia unamae]|uniref:glycosyltransferase family 2 protein n=1 Tax=Paraburkholderia unamae TaxID=219649 RepID=UPI001CAC301B|nr:glycosyltransferase family 2 protein [Paraburkholderia unamae]CAG9250546.1 CPS-53 (KpLE1) prophage; bactoprenol glucosyl transferase [Paraburkholderia unamae]